MSDELTPEQRLEMLIFGKTSEWSENKTADEPTAVGVPSAQNPIELGLELLLGGIRLLAEEAAVCEMWHAVAEAYFLGNPEAQNMYRQALRFMEETGYGEEQ
jgi:hypothetical protein